MEHLETLIWTKKLQKKLQTKVSILFIFNNIVKRHNKDSNEYKQYVSYFVSYLFLKAKEKRLFEKNLYLQDLAEQKEVI